MTMTTGRLSVLEQFKGVARKEEKELIPFIQPVDPSIKTKLQGMAIGGFGTSKPCLITIELIREAIEEYKQEKQIYSLEITQTSCTELALSYKKILQISNLENLINVHTLRLDNNMIMKIENLSKLKNIKWLDLSFNYISKIEGLDDLENLTDLSLFSNQIEEVKNLDKNRKLNVLSVGNNRINDCKILANYLKRFSSLQALCVHMNPFCKDEESVQKKLEQNQNNFRYPNSYEPLIQSLLTLKYLDWKPINEEYRSSVINSSQHSGKDDLMGIDLANEEKMMEERAKLHKADLDEIIDFFPRVLQSIKEEVAPGVGWDKLMKIPGLEDRIALTEKGINEDIEAYKAQVLGDQAQKDLIISKNQKELEKDEEMFIEKSKKMIRDFKRVFKQFTKDLKAGKIKGIKTPEDTEIHKELEKLKNDLLEIEIYEKQQLFEFIKTFKKAVGDKNAEMSDKTDQLRLSLDAKKNGLKESIGTIIAEVKAKIDNYNESAEKFEEGGFEEEPKMVDNELQELSNIFLLTDFNSDLEKITEVLDDKISKLKDTLDGARSKSTDDYFENLQTNEYYRNKKRIQDIQEIYNIYWEKIKEELDKNQESNNNAQA